MAPTSQALAKLHMAIIYMSQEAAFGLKIEFPPEVSHLTEKKLEDLTEEECKQLARAGMTAHAKALGLEQ